MESQFVKHILQMLEMYPCYARTELYFGTIYVPIHDVPTGDEIKF